VRSEQASSAMTSAVLEEYLHTHIPLSRAMSVAVVDIADDWVTLQAPLAPNINHRETVFGGSASALAILAAWSLLHTRLHRLGIHSRLVIQRNTMEYNLPIDGIFIAESKLTRPDAWDRFVRTLKRRGRARLAVDAVLKYDARVAGHFHGEFVALGHEPVD
jgi:thioesterase domain-containing protein